eukprot:10396399-Alexandrium_andersonii.AAC.1
MQARAPQLRELRPQRSAQVRGAGAHDLGLLQFAGSCSLALVSAAGVAARDVHGGLHARGPAGRAAVCARLGSH